MKWITFVLRENPREVTARELFFRGPLARRPVLGMNCRMSLLSCIRAAHIWSIAVLATGLMSATEPVSAQSASGARRALLIGINDYRNVAPLRGSLNDIASMQEVLVTRWGFTPDQITVVQDAAATRAGILAALDQLVRTAQPNDFVYIHYSGHGSQVKDLNGDEPDGLDETIVPQDGRGAGVPDITDDELDALFARLRTKRAVIVLDSCHSGTATRAVDVQTRSVPQDSRLDLYQHAASTQTRAIVSGTTPAYVLFSAAASNQEALDGPIDGTYHGFFSYALSRSAAGMSTQASPREIFAGATAELARIEQRFGRVAMPEPQLEGAPESLARSLIADGSASAALLGVSNPASSLRVDVAVVPPSSVATRDIVAADRIVTSQYRIRGPQDPRGSSNSLQLDIRTSADAFITVVDIDAAGAVSQLFPTGHQKPGFLPQGFVRGGTTVRIPDSLEPGNLAGFYWDYGPPAGVDTIRVFAAADLATAKLIRSRVAGMSALNVQSQTRALHADLMAAQARAVNVVADESRKAPEGQPPAADWAAAAVTVVVGN